MTLTMLSTTTLARRLWNRKLQVGITRLKSKNYCWTKKLIAITLKENSNIITTLMRRLRKPSMILGKKRRSLMEWTILNVREWLRNLSKRLEASSKLPIGLFFAVKAWKKLNKIWRLNNNSWTIWRKNLKNWSLDSSRCIKETTIKQLLIFPRNLRSWRLSQLVKYYWFRLICPQWGRDRKVALRCQKIQRKCGKIA